MAEVWLSTSWTQAGLVVLSTLVIFLSVITYTRIAGLRSFSKMSSFDFASTVAVGSLMASVAVTQASLLNGVIALGTLYAAQSGIAVLRRHTGIEKVIDNRPVLLMAGPQVLHENLRRSSVTQRDLVAKLREANVVRPDQVLAVVLETTGDVNVLHGEGPLDPAVMMGVKGQEHLDV